MFFITINLGIFFVMEMYVCRYIPKDSISLLDHIDELVISLVEHRYSLGKVYVETDPMSKPFMKRSVASAMLKYIEEPRVVALAVYTIEHLGRNLYDILETINVLERKYQIIIYSVREPWIHKNHDRMNNLIDYILDWMRRRVREAQNRAWASGKQKGRPRKLSKKVVKQYVMKYRDLAVKNKKVIWEIMRAEGIDVSYNTARRYINEVLKELGW